MAARNRARGWAARGWALQALYAWETRGGGAERVVPVLEGMLLTHRVRPANRLRAEVLVKLVGANLARIDRVLRANLTNWSMSRLTMVDRNILRLGVAEMLFVDDMAPRDTMRAMVRLAELYGTSESPRFVNGVLDAVMRSLEGEGEPGPR